MPRCHETLFIVELLREITPFFAGVLKQSLGMKYAVCKHSSLQEMNDERRPGSVTQRPWTTPE